MSPPDPRAVPVRELPKYECLRSLAARFPQLDPKALEACVTLVMVSRNVGVSFEAFFATCGLSEGRFSVLMILYNHPENQLSPSELADKMGVTRATMTGLLDGLEREGHVVRSQHPFDRRTLTTQLTQKGRELLEGMLPEHFRRVMDLMSALTPEEQQSLTQLLLKLHEKVPSLGAPRGDA